ncbi:MAG TPA: hypothetical protein VGM84_07540 [Steroidobacteraceae bacterium]
MRSGYSEEPSTSAPWQYSAASEYAMRHVLGTLLFGLISVTLSGRDHASSAETSQQATSERDGAHDFDFEFGSWKTHLRRLQRPLSGSTAWVEYNGTTQVDRILGGRANLVELQVAGPAGRIDGMSWRLYEPETHQWTLNFANVRDGKLTTPMIGRFHEGRGSFYGQDTLNGRTIFVRFLITRVAADSIHFEQAFSADGGQTWEVNWIAEDTRVAR